MTTVSPEAVQVTLARLIADQLERESAPPKVFPGFTETFGPASYRAIMTGRHSRRRRAHLESSACEIRNCDSGSRKLVFDHCHVHGWVRGVTCASHNCRLGQIDAVREMSGIVINFSATVYGAHLDNCPECAGNPAPELISVMTAIDAFEARYPDSRARITSRMIAKSGGNTAHLALTPTRTWCGRNADGMVIPVRPPRWPCIQCYERAYSYADRNAVPRIPGPKKINWEVQAALF
jgi:hypothetical protein